MISPFKQIDFANTGLLPKLVSDYLQNAPAVKQLYNYPFELESFASIIADKQNDTTNRKLLFDVLQQQYHKLSRHTAVDNNIQSLLSNKTFTVTAAHQPCLLLGPLYNILKISSTINLASQLEQHYPDYHFVPVFWLGSEDHDIDELNHTYINNQKFEWANAGSGAVGRLNSTGISVVIEQLKQANANPDVIALTESCLAQFETFGSFSQAFVHELFKEHGLVVLNQDDAALKLNFAAIIEQEVEQSVAEKVLQPALQFLEANYKVQAQPRNINFFYLGNGYRERLIRNTETGNYEVKDKSIAFTDAELKAAVKQQPQNFSPNVIYRPLYQEYTLPNLAFVGGAGELSYWLELKALFSHYKINYPMLVMRASMAIVNQGFAKKLEKLNLPAENLFSDIEQLVTAYVKDNLQGNIYLTDEKGKLDELFNQAAAKAEAVDPTLKQSVLSDKQKALAAFDNMEAKMLKAEKRKHETAVNQVRSLHATIFPDGILQERREGFVAFYNARFIDSMVANASPFDKAFKIMIND